jgi:hypothetical protein
LVSGAEQPHTEFSFLSVAPRIDTPDTNHVNEDYYTGNLSQVIKIRTGTLSKLKISKKITGIKELIRTISKPVAVLPHRLIFFRIFRRTASSTT